eukprot:g79560.t1
MAEPIEGEFVLWLILRMHSKTVKANPRYFFTIQSPIFDDRMHVACITMFEETEATKATGHKGFRVCVESLFLQLRGGPPVKGVGREGMIIKLQLGWQDKLPSSTSTKMLGRTCRGGDARRRRALPRRGPRSASSGSQPYVATTSATWSQAPWG